ncbi:MAG: AAA family ATPase [Acholeplasmataceae bacterium]|nr:AAA family ATPase [Acholeplasmataceae bacterium]
MSKKLSRIMIYGLFGGKNYDIPLNRLDGVTVLHGLNGCGKTTILRMINGFFSGDYTDFDRVPFNGVHFCFDDNTKICIFSTLYNLLIHKCPKEENRHLKSILRKINDDYIDLIPLDFLTDDRLFFTYIDDNLKTSKTMYLDKCGNHDLRLDTLVDKFKSVKYEQIVPILEEYEGIFSEIKEEQIQNTEYNRKLQETKRDKEPSKKKISSDIDLSAIDPIRSVDTNFLGENLFSELIKTINFEDISLEETVYPQFLFDINNGVVPKFLESQRVFQINLSNTVKDDPYNINNRFKTLINRTKEELVSEVKKCHEEHSATHHDRFYDLVLKPQHITKKTLETDARKVYDRIKNLLSQDRNVCKFAIDWDYIREIRTKFPGLIWLSGNTGMEEVIVETEYEYSEYERLIGEPLPEPKVIFHRDFSHPDEAKKLRLVLDDINEELDILEDLKSRLDDFDKFIKMFGFMPDFECDFTQGTMELKSKEFKQVITGYRLILEREEFSIPLNALSSGEQNLLLMIFDLILDSQESSLILIDEPEISLHISWQNKFLKCIKEIRDNYLFDVIVATHSPDIIYDHWDWTVALGPGEE